MTEATNENIQDFTKKMLSDNIFTCSICKNLLIVPVMLVADVGNVCHNCFEDESEENEWESVPNTTLDTLLKELKFPCKFETQGCNNEVLYDDLKQHESQCFYRPVDCLMPKEECEWNGKLVDLPKHFKEDHSKHVLQGPYEEFSFETNVEKISTVIKLLNHRNRSYILRIEKLQRDNSLLHFLQDITSTTDTADSKMIVKYVGKNNVYKAKLQVLSINVAREERNGKKILLSTLKEVAQQSDTVKIVIKPEKCEIKNINSEIMKLLECPVCKQVMRQPVLQCPTGHSICEFCRKRLAECPTCREEFLEQNVRNFSLEALTPYVQYPCVYSQFGCTSTFLGCEIEKHEEKCKYQMYECPKDACNFTGSYSSCQNHFKVNHKEDLVEGTVYKSNFTPLGNRMVATTQTVYFFEHGNIFELSFSRSADSCTWCVRILNSYDKCVQYYFTVRVIDPRVTQRFVAKSTLCTGKNMASANNNIISFTYDSLTMYKNTGNDQMNFSCEIFAEKSS